jgi:TonB family protein
VRQYREGRFAEAQKHFERALELDPTQRNVPLFIARALQGQYRPGAPAPENVARGLEAVEAYRRVLDREPDNEDAFASAGYLYAQLKDREGLRDLVLQRAASPAVPRAKRADAYVLLASKEWLCTYDITEANKQVNATTAVVTYRKPESLDDFERAAECVKKGLEFAEEAVNLQPSNSNAWTHRANLLREMSKLAEMDGRAADRASYDRQADEAEEEQRRLLVMQSPLQEVQLVTLAGGDALTDAAAPPPPPKPTPEPQPASPLISGGVLDGKAVFKPHPPYPPVARAARASGVVVVRILVDEEGKVIEAQAVSGHPLLQQAAAAAARHARFSPAYLEGRPARVSGVVTYKFELR